MNTPVPPPPPNMPLQRTAPPTMPWDKPEVAKVLNMLNAVVISMDKK